MPNKSPETIANELLQAINTSEHWQVFDVDFRTRISSLLIEIMSSSTFSKKILDPVSYPEEGKVVASFCFFDGKIRELLTNDDFNDTFMKSLMIESSQNMNDWLMMRKLLQRKKPYLLLLNGYASNLLTRAANYQNSPIKEASSQTIDVGPLAILAEVLNKALVNADPDFRLSILELFQIFIGTKDPTNLLAPFSPRREANAITYDSFRNRLLDPSIEDMHDGQTPVNEENIARLLNESGRRLGNWLLMMDKLAGFKTYPAIVNIYWSLYSRYWEE